MAMVCPRCRGSFEQRWQCPSCGVRLAYQARWRETVGEGSAGNPWGQTPWGRIVLGVILAQGLYQGLRQLVTAGLLAAGDGTAQSVWSTIYGLVILQAIQALCLILAGTLAGAGLRQGVVFGAIVGVWNGIVAVVVQSAAGGPHTAIVLLGQPILHTFFGAAGGFLGGQIWKPLPILAGPASPQVAPPVLAARARRGMFDGPFAWGRLLLGATVAVAGAIWSHVILDAVLEASQGALNITDNLQAQLVTWEVMGLAMLAGSALAGAGTVNSLKQGLGVGLGVAAVLLGMRFAGRPMSAHELILTASSSLALGLVGAWFGGSLFPPVVAPPRRLAPSIMVG